MTVSVSWGYELHSVDVDAEQWKRIRQGEAVMIRNIGWYEGQSFNCYWFFDDNAEYSLIVDYGEDGGRGFNGDIRDAIIDENSPSK